MSADSGADLVDRVRARFVLSGEPVTDAAVAAAVRAEGLALRDATVLGERSARLAVARVGAALTGAGPLQRLLDDVAVTDVLVNGPHEVWVDRGSGLERTDVDLGSVAALRQLAQRLSTLAGRRLDDASPWVDARISDTVRMHAVLPPVCAGGPLMSLRIARPVAFTLAELAECGTIGPLTAPLLDALIAHRRAMVVTGGTGSGKTTILNAMLGAVSPDERLVLVEDVAELRPRHPHVVRLEARPANLEGAGAVSMRDLVRQALRMRPDRVVIGEARGREIVDLLSALNTGHEGGLATLHARSPRDVPARIEALAAGEGFARHSLAAMLDAAVDVVVHVRRDGPHRRISEVAVLQRDRAGECVVVPAIVDERPGQAWAALQRLVDRAGAA